MVLTSGVVSSRNILLDDAVFSDNRNRGWHSVCKGSICCAVNLDLSVLLGWKAQYTCLGDL